MGLIQKYINQYWYKITIQNAIGIAIQIASCFWVKVVSVHNLLADAVARLGD